MGTSDFLGWDAFGDAFVFGDPGTDTGSDASKGTLPAAKAAQAAPPLTFLFPVRKQASKASSKHSIDEGAQALAAPLLELDALKAGADGAGLQHPRGTRDGTQDPDSTLADTTRKPASTREGQQPPASKKAQTSDAEDRYRQPSLDTAHPHTSRDQQQQQQHPTPLSPSARGGRSFSGGSAFRSLNSTAPSQGLRSGGSCSGGGGALCHTMSLREAAAGHAPAGTGSCSGPVSGQQHTCPLSGHAAWHGTEWWRRFSSSRLNELAQEEPDPHSPEMRRVPFTGGASPMCALVHGEERQEATSTSA